LISFSIPAVAGNKPLALMVALAAEEVGVEVLLDELPRQLNGKILKLE
jgi:hypothetical protein